MWYTTFHIQSHQRSNGLILFIEYKEICISLIFWVFIVVFLCRFRSSLPTSGGPYPIQMNNLFFRWVRLVTNKSPCFYCSNWNSGGQGITPICWSLKLHWWYYKVMLNVSFSMKWSLVSLFPSMFVHVTACAWKIECTGKKQWDLCVIMTHGHKWTSVVCVNVLCWDISTH